jgi:hypothetical protein
MISDEQNIDRILDEEHVDLVEISESTRLVRIKSAATASARTNAPIESISLRSVSDVRVLLEMISRDVLNSDLSPQRARALADVARLSLAIIESEDLERENKVLRDLISTVPEAQKLLAANARTLRVMR